MTDSRPQVHGVDVDDETRCTHYGSDLDVIALRFGCCERYFSCKRCHDVVADHDSEPWPASRFDDPAVYCGVCETTLTVSTYLECDHTCPHCQASFNPGCRRHAHWYFEGVDPASAKGKE